MDKPITFLLLLFVLNKDGRGTAGFTRSAHAALNEDQLAFHQNHQDGESMLTLKVQVKNGVSQQPLSHANVEVFANYTLINSTMTGRAGVTVLRVPRTHIWPLVLVARKDGYIQTPVVWKTTKIPIFSCVTLRLFYQNQGNIWLFEDLVIVTGKLSDSAPFANVKFPKRLLSLPDSNISSLTAYLTLPHLHDFPNTTGIIMSKSGYKSVELTPIAAVSVQILYTGVDLQISGPAHITLPLAESSQSQLSYAVPAWSFDRDIGAWVNHGLGTVQMENRRPVWVYTAPYLDYWIAAPFPASTGYMGHEGTLDFISYLLVPVVGGGFLTVVGLLSVLSCYCRESYYKQRRERVCRRRAAAQKKEQTTTRNSGNEQLDHVSLSEKNKHRAAARQSASVCKRNEADVKSAFHRRLRKTGVAEVPFHKNRDKLTQHSLTTPQTPNNANRVDLLIPASMHQSVFPESLVLYNQPMTFNQVPRHVTSLEQQSGSPPATPASKADRYTELERPADKQTVPKLKIVSEVKEQARSTETPNGEPKAKGRGFLLESVSVPDTLNKATGTDSPCGSHQGRSERTLLEISRSNPCPHPKAWFVSLEGKPAAQVWHSIVDFQKCHLLTSLDSGISANEQHRKQDMEI